MIKLMYASPRHLYAVMHASYKIFVTKFFNFWVCIMK